MSYHNFLRFGTYTGIAFSVILSITYPQYRIFAFLIVGGWLVYAISDTWQIAENQDMIHDYRRFVKALSSNAVDVGLFFLSIIIAIALGV
jgi:hypothetical protein